MKKSFIELHLSIFLAGFTGVFGKLISLNEGLLVWYRMFFAAVIFIVFLMLTKKMPKITPKEIFKIAGVGFIMALHWVSFYGSIKYSNISIGVVCISAVGFFTAILEPFFNKKGISSKEIFLSLIAILGIYLIFHFDSRYRVGIVLGILSSLLAATFIVLNKKIVVHNDSGTMLLYEMIGGVTGLTLLMPLYLHFFPVENIFPGGKDLIYLVILAIFCTVITFICQTDALKNISAFTVNLSYNLEPIYSIILAMIIFNEAKDLNFAFYAGLFLIIISVLLQTFSFSKKQIIKSNPQKY